MQFISALFKEMPSMPQKCRVSAAFTGWIQMNPLMNPVGSKAEEKLNCINAVVITQKDHDSKNHGLFFYLSAAGRNSAYGRSPRAQHGEAGSYRISERVICLLLTVDEMGFQNRTT